MPRIRKPEIPFVKMKRLLLGYEMNGPKMGEILGCSAKTGKARLDNPQTLTLADLDNISKKGHIPIEEIREAITK